MSESPVVTVQTRDNLIIVRVLSDRLEEQQLRELQNEVRAAADAHPRWPCILDLSRVESVASLTLAAFIRLHSEFQARQQRLLLAGLEPKIRDLFVATRLDRFLELQDDIDTAARALGAN